MNATGLQIMFAWEVINRLFCANRLGRPDYIRWDIVIQEAEAEV